MFLLTAFLQRLKFYSSFEQLFEWILFVLFAKVHFIWLKSIQFVFVLFKNVLFSAALKLCFAEAVFKKFKPDLTPGFVNLFIFSSITRFHFTNSKYVSLLLLTILKDLLFLFLFKNLLFDFEAAKWQFASHGAEFAVLCFEFCPQIAVA